MSCKRRSSNRRCHGEYARVVGGVVVALGALTASAVVLGGCGGDRSSEKLRALEADPIAQYVPPGGELVESRGENEGSTFGKPKYASYRRVFELPPRDPERQLEQAAEAARAAGWKITEREPFRVGETITHGGRKRLATGNAELGITVFPHGPPSGKTTHPTMQILLHHYGS